MDGVNEISSEGVFNRKILLTIYMNRFLVWSLRKNRRFETDFTAIGTLSSEINIFQCDFMLIWFLELYEEKGTAIFSKLISHYTMKIFLHQFQRRVLRNSYREALYHLYTQIFCHFPSAMSPYKSSRVAHCAYKSTLNFRHAQ